MPFRVKMWPNKNISLSKFDILVQKNYNREMENSWYHIQSLYIVNSALFFV